MNYTRRNEEQEMTLSLARKAFDMLPTEKMTPEEFEKTLIKIGKILPCEVPPGIPERIFCAFWIPDTKKSPQALIVLDGRVYKVPGTSSEFIEQNLIGNKKFPSLNLYLGALRAYLVNRKKASIAVGTKHHTLFTPESVNGMFICLEELDFIDYSDETYNYIIMKNGLVIPVRTSSKTLKEIEWNAWLTKGAVQYEFGDNPHEARLGFAKFTKTVPTSHNKKMLAKIRASDFARDDTTLMEELYKIRREKEYRKKNR